MIRQSAFTEKAYMLKGGLHCHTTRSDGKGTPEAVIALHEENGYDFLALTDHRIYNFKNYLPGSRLTIIPGMEMDWNIAPKHPIHCFHIVFLGREKPNNPYEQDQRFEGGIEISGQEELQPYLDQAHADGQLTFYCHPQWSSTFVREFECLQGNFAMELWNSGSVRGFNIDTNNGFLWDELLMQGKRVYGVAVDDGHSMEDHCHGWVRVRAENNVDSILAALKEGSFYASSGPEIYDFYIDDDGFGHVECSPCREIRFVCATRAMRRLFDESGSMTSGMMPTAVNEFFPYLRVEVTDAQGNTAWTNPIFLHDEK